MTEQTTTILKNYLTNVPLHQSNYRQKDAESDSDNKFLVTLLFIRRVITNQSALLMKLFEN